MGPRWGHNGTKMGSKQGSRKRRKKGPPDPSEKADNFFNSGHILVKLGRNVQHTIYDDMKQKKKDSKEKVPMYERAYREEKTEFVN